MLLFERIPSPARYFLIESEIEMINGLAAKYGILSPSSSNLDRRLISTGLAIGYTISIEVIHSLAIQ
jgi:hypothetical protein